MIVAHGAQTADGHDPGAGRVENDDVVLCDLFPQHYESACFADMTRTFLVGGLDATLLPGTPSASRRSSSRLDGATRCRGRRDPPGRQHLFDERGHATQASGRRATVLREGFNHALGHGVGLDVHEAPGLGRRRATRSSPAT